MRVVRTLSIIVGLSLTGVVGLGTSAVGEQAPPTSTASVRGNGVATGYPTLVNVRWARHTGYDRVVFDFTGGTPDWAVGYGTLVREGTGTAVPLAGDADLVVRFSHARAHTDDGRATYPMTRTLDPLLPSLRQIRFGGDYEGYVTAGLGLRERAGFRVTRLAGPPRIVVDVAHRAASPFGFSAVTRTGANVVTTGIRTGRHAGYDRVVFDVRGTASPAFTVRYSADTSLLLVKIGGTFAGTSPGWVGHPAVRSVRLGHAGDGVVIFRVATAQRHGFRVSVLRDPTRLVVDVRH